MQLTRWSSVVGHVGSGTSEIAKQLKIALEDIEMAGEHIDVEIIKAKPFIDLWATDHNVEKPDVDGIRLVNWYQDIGDEMRKEQKDYSSIARQFAIKIRELRAAKIGVKLIDDEPVIPDGRPRAYILDSIRHPDEVELLRHVYQDAFVLIGVVCQETTRIARLSSKHADGGSETCKALMQRDAKAGPKHGQRTGDAFHMADFFVDNSVDRLIDDAGQRIPNPHWEILSRLERFVNILSHGDVIRPTIDETAMHHAYSAQLRSACLSRQVGASLVDGRGNLLASGTNEVPRAGGGVYGESVSIPRQSRGILTYRFHWLVLLGRLPGNGNYHRRRMCRLTRCCTSVLNGSLGRKRTLGDQRKWLNRDLHKILIAHRCYTVSARKQPVE